MWNIIVDEFVYAREAKDNSNTAILAEKLRAGVKVDPVELQNVYNYPDHNREVPLLINGGHRLDAYEIVNKERQDTGNPPLQPEFVYYSDEVLDYETAKTELAIRSHNANDAQGLNSRMQDTRKIARNICQAKPEWTEEEIAAKLHRHPSTISKYISDILQKRRASQHCLIMRLACLGWTQEAIGNLVGLTGQRVGQIENNLSVQEIFNSLNSGKSIDEIAKYNDIDVQTAWNLVLREKSDIEKLSTLSESLQGFTLDLKVYDVETYPQCLPLTGTAGYPGQIPGQLVINTLCWHTKAGDLVIDPMAGGGTVADACLLMNRQCHAYDRTPSRNDILEHDITTELANRKRANLIFLDPPYFKKKADEYDLPAEYLTKAGFMEFAGRWVHFCNLNLRKDGIVAFLMSDYIDWDDPGESFFSHEYVPLFTSDGYTLLYKVSCDIPPAQGDGEQINKAKEKLCQRLMRGRELYILRKDS